MDTTTSALRPTSSAQAVKKFTMTLKQLEQAVWNEMSAAGRSKQQINNHTSAFGRFLSSIGLATSATIGTELGSGFDEHLLNLTDRMKAENKSDRYLRDTITHLLSWKSAYERLSCVDSLPKDFTECLGALLLASGRTLVSIAACSKVALDTLKLWKYGRSTPSLVNRGQLAALEIELNVPVGTLLRRLPRSHRADSPQYTRTCDESEHRTDFQRNLAKLKREKFRYKLDFDDALRLEWQHLCKFKTDAFLADGLERNSSWRLAPKHQVGHRYSCAAEVGTQLCASAEATWSHISAVLGVLAMPVAIGGQGEDPTTISTLAVLSDAERVLAWVTWRMANSQGKMHTGIATLLAVVLSMLRAKTGYLWQHADMYARRFPEPERALGESHVSLSKEGIVSAWQAWCERNHKRLSSVFSNAKHDHKFVKSRDPKAAIASIIALDRPLDALLEMIDQMELNLAPTTTPVRRAIDLRDILFMKFLTSNPLRVKHLAVMTYSPRNTGNIYQGADGTWRLRFMAEIFKNTKGAAWDDYDVPIPSYLAKDIERYIAEARPLLANADKCNFFFLPSRSGIHVKIDGTDRKMWSSTISNRIRMLSRMYIEGCPGFGAHALRHIVARDYLKRHPGDYPNVAHLLHDKLETVLREYGDTEVADGLRRLHSDIEDWNKRSEKDRGAV